MIKTRSPKNSRASSAGTWDVIIVGGGPAGASAALMLGRCRRRVLLFDDGVPRNLPARAAHGFYTRDGEEPLALQRIAHEQLRTYGVQVRAVHVTDARRIAGGFRVRDQRGRWHRCIKLVLATGVEDIHPAIPGFENLLGESVWPCPYCDGWEVRDQPLAALGHGRDGVQFAVGLKSWSDDVIFFSNGVGRLDDRSRKRLREQGIRWVPQKIVRLEGKERELRAVVLKSGERLERRALFFHLGVRQRSALPQRLGCKISSTGVVKTSPRTEQTGVDGLYVVGDASRDAMFIAVAAAEGLKAACSINRQLREALTG